MIIHSGGRASGFKNIASNDSLDIDGVALFHVRGTQAINTIAVQVPEVASSLNSEDTFVLVTPSTVYSWNGTAANASEIAAAQSYAVLLAADYLGHSGRTCVPVSEGAEPDEFWDTLGGKSLYSSTSECVENAPREPRLFSASTATGKFEVIEVSGKMNTTL